MDRKPKGPGKGLASSKEAWGQDFNPVGPRVLLPTRWDVWRSLGRGVVEILLLVDRRKERFSKCPLKIHVTNINETSYLIYSNIKILPDEKSDTKTLLEKS